MPPVACRPAISRIPDIEQAYAFRTHFNGIELKPICYGIGLTYGEAELCCGYSECHIGHDKSSRHLAIGFTPHIRKRDHAIAVHLYLVFAAIQRYVFYLGHSPYFGSGDLYQSSMNLRSVAAVYLMSQGQIIDAYLVKGGRHRHAAVCHDQRSRIVTGHTVFYHPLHGLAVVGVYIAHSELLSRLHYRLVYRDAFGHRRFRQRHIITPCNLRLGTSVKAYGRYAHSHFPAVR